MLGSYSSVGFSCIKFPISTLYFVESSKKPRLQYWHMQEWIVRSQFINNVFVLRRIRYRNAEVLRTKVEVLRHCTQQEGFPSDWDDSFFRLRFTLIHSTNLGFTQLYSLEDWRFNHSGPGITSSEIRFSSFWELRLRFWSSERRNRSTSIYVLLYK